MLRKRIIFTLIYNQKFFMQSRNFRLQKVGDINWLEKYYKFQKISFSIDELIILDVSREKRSFECFAKTIERLSQNVFIPIAVGGGIRDIHHAESLFKNGADKIVLNSILIEKPHLVHELVHQYGSQSIIASIDYKIINGIKQVLIENGTKKINLSLSDYIDYVSNLNVGEIYLNSIDKDGTGFGYDFTTIHDVKNSIHLPLIIAGGAGNMHHLLEGLEIDEINAVATANLFNFLGESLPNARKRILQCGKNIAAWSSDYD